jgi:alkylhydroperoxidase family enzyme
MADPALQDVLDAFAVEPGDGRRYSGGMPGETRTFLITCHVIETTRRGVEELSRERIPRSERNQEMHKFVVHTIESAPEKSRQPLQVLKQKFGFVPNVAATMAESPVLINAFIGGFASFHGGSFSEAEKQALLLTNAVTLKCPWAVAFHSSMALHEGVASSDVRAIRDGKLPTDVKYAALSGIAKALIEKRGNVTETDIANFTSAGYSQVQILEVITGIGMSTMASTTGNLAGTPVEDHLKAQIWAAASTG